jgi:hypothetical protein
MPEFARASRKRNESKRGALRTNTKIWITPLYYYYYYYYYY